MINKSNQTVCDQTGVILNDGVTLFPGYIEVKNGLLTRYDSGDPNNEKAASYDPRQGYTPGMLHHRVEFKTVVITETCDNPILQDKHFMSRIAMDKYLADKTTT